MRILIKNNENAIRKLLSRCTKDELIDLIFKQNKQAFSSNVLYEFINYKVEKTIKEINELNNKFDELYEEMKQEDYFSKRRKEISKELERLDRKETSLYKTLQCAMK